MSLNRKERGWRGCKYCGMEHTNNFNFCTMEHRSLWIERHNIRMENRRIERLYEKRLMVFQPPASGLYHGF